MCSFLVTNWILANLTYVNFFMRPRGPDATNLVTGPHNYTFLHNLLQMTGPPTLQPFIDESDTIYAVYNGEIYNFDSSRFASDGLSIVPLYQEHGWRFVQKLDGEFAVVLFDFAKKTVVLSTDVFGTKPLWYAITDEGPAGIQAASYKSALERLGIPSGDIQMAPPNTIRVYSLESLELLHEAEVFTFDLRQHKYTTADYISAFERAVEKRVRYVQHPVFIGLSAGYDSGAIHLALKRLNLRHHSYSITGSESFEILDQRLQYTNLTGGGNAILLSIPTIDYEGDYLDTYCENFLYNSTDGAWPGVRQDPASVGLSVIFRQVRRSKQLVYLSGSGADETISDYGFNGTKFYPHSNFGGLFPKDLKEIFPWESFYYGTQRDYLMKEEHVAGTHGVEARYPFLDPEVVQEFLWIAADVKNGNYKAPLKDYFALEKYPYLADQKIGFQPFHHIDERRPKTIVLYYDAVKKEYSTRQVAEDGMIIENTEEVSKQMFMSCLEGLPEEGKKNRTLSEWFSLAGMENQDHGRESQVCDNDKLNVRKEDLDATEKHLRSIHSQLDQEIKAHYDYVEKKEKMIKNSSDFVQDGFRGILNLLIYAYVDIQKYVSHGYSFPDLAPPSSDVKVITCVSGGTTVVQMDIPTFNVFNATASKMGVEVHNLCETYEWSGTKLRLRKYRELLEQHIDDEVTLFFVSDGTDVFFNDITPILEEGENFSALLRRKYKKFGKPIVISSERLCGWGGAFLCSQEEADRFPDGPTSSKFLNAGGYVGLARDLHSMISEVIATRAELCDKDPDSRYCGGPDGQADQYFFINYFWNHQDTVALDYHHEIFGNFVEVGETVCRNGWKPRCAFKPCCTESDEILEFNRTYNDRYEVNNCTVTRHGHTPITWHGNGVGKWFFFISLQRVVRNCAHVANEMWKVFSVDQMMEGIYSIEHHQLRRWDDNQT